MDLPHQTQRLTIYIGESDQWHGHPLWQALLERLRQEGLAGATVLRGLAGFGAHSRIHTATLVRLSVDLPLVLIVVDRADKIERVLPTVSAMVPEGLITLEPIQVVKYSHRYLPQIPPERRVGEVMTRDVKVVHPETPLTEVATLLLRELFTAVPVVDETGRVVGLISDGDFLRWPELALRFRQPEGLTGTTLERLLAELHAGEHTAAEIMTTAVITVVADQPVTEAAHMMVQRGLKRLPVVNAEGRLVGMLSRIDILRTVAHEARAPAGAPAIGPELHLLRDVMRRDVPTVARNAQLSEIVDKMVASDLRRVIVVDQEQRPVGIITDGDLVARVQPAARRSVLEALLARVGLGEAEPATGEQRAADLMSTPLLIASEETPILAAIQRLVAEKRRRLVVVDEAGRLSGLVDRQSLLRALLGGEVRG